MQNVVAILLPVLYVILQTPLAYGIILWCSESVYEYSSLCTIENYSNNVPIDVNTEFQSIYRVSSITNIRFQNSTIDVITNGIFKKFQYLKSLDVTNSRVSQLSENSFMSASQLTRLNLSNNCLEELLDTSFSGAYNLSLIDLSYNRITNIHYAVFRNFRDLDLIDLSHNRLSTFPANLHLKCNEMNLNFNQITIVTFGNKTSIKRVSFNNNKINYLNVTDHLECLNITNNTFTSLKNFKLTKNLSHLDLSFNRLDNSDHSVHDVLSKLTNLKSLILKSVQLNYSDLVLFYGLRELQTLDVSSNNLTFLDFNFLRRLRSLKDLSIADNNLNKLNFDELNYFNLQLKTIDISENNWTCSDLIVVLNKLKQFEIEVVSNDRDTTEIVTNIRDIRCNNELNIQVVTDIPLPTVTDVQQSINESATLLNHEYNSSLALLQIALIVCICIIMLCIIRLLYECARSIRRKKVGKGWQTVENPHPNIELMMTDEFVDNASDNSSSNHYYEIVQAS